MTSAAEATLGPSSWPKAAPGTRIKKRANANLDMTAPVILTVEESTGKTSHGYSGPREGVPPGVGYRRGRRGMIAVVGAGLTGLVLAHELARREIEHGVFEAADTPGGVIRSRRVEGRILEFGPQRGRMTAGLAALIADLGLEREALYAPEGLPLFVYADDALREVAFDAKSLLTGDLLSL